VERQGRQIVLSRRKALDVIELGHRAHAAIEIESSAVVSAPKRLKVRLAFDDHGAPVRTDVAQAAHLPVVGVRQNERLVETSIQEDEREDMTRRFQTGDVADRLPASREHLFLGRLVNTGIVIDPSRKGARPADIGVDVNAFGHTVNMVTPRSFR
jgi:hypothetical protein